MFEFLDFVVNGIERIGSLLNQYKFYVAGINVSILDLLIGFIVLAIIIAVFWKGARA